MTIIPARPQDAMLIGASVVDAIGEEIAANLAGENHTVNDVIDMFATLAAREDSQYSYRNALVAVDDDDTPVGVCVGYDGAKLHELRRPFFETVTEKLGHHFEGVEYECEPEDFYLNFRIIKYWFHCLPSVLNEKVSSCHNHNHYQKGSCPPKPGFIRFPAAYTKQQYCTACQYNYIRCYFCLFP